MSLFYRLQSSAALSCTLLTLAACPAIADAVVVNAKNFIRAESDGFFSNMVKMHGGVGILGHERQMAALDKQEIVRLNRDTIYSSGVYDLDAGPITITLPEADGRFMSLQVLDQDHYTLGVHYKPGTYTIAKDDAGSRYVMVGFRTLANPLDEADMAIAHKLQDQITVEQSGGPGTFEIPEWDSATRDSTRAKVLALAADVPDTQGMFGSKEQVDPILHLLGTAMGWGGNPDRDAFYLNLTPQNNDGKTAYKLTVKDVPVDGFWSITVYNEQGYIEQNELNAYAINNLTATPSEDGSITVQFGGCEATTVNCLPVPENWNYLVRMYQPQEAILDGTWKFPELEAVQ